MKTKETKELYQNVNLSVIKHRKRIGCDICKEDESTQCFIGWVGDILWICGHCFNKITTPKSTAKVKK